MILQHQRRASPGPGYTFVQGIILEHLRHLPLPAADLAKAPALHCLARHCAHVPLGGSGVRGPYGRGRAMWEVKSLFHRQFHG